MTWQKLFTDPNKKLKEIKPLVTETEKHLRQLHKRLQKYKDESIEVTLNAAEANLKKIHKVISSRTGD